MNFGRIFLLLEEELVLSDVPVADRLVQLLLVDHVAIFAPHLEQEGARGRVASGLIVHDFDKDRAEVRIFSILTTCHDSIKLV